MTNTAPLEGIILPATDEAAALVTIQAPKVQDLFLAPSLMDALLAYVTEQATAFTPDVTTAKGRKELASRAYRCAQTKTYLDGLGKALVDDLKKLPAQIDASRKVLRDRLDALRDKVREPLTAWEARLERHKAGISAMQNLPAKHFTSTSAQLEQAVAELQALDPASFEELEQDAASAKTVTLATLQEQLEKRLKWEADQLELERLRKAEAERQEEARKEQLRKEGEERARKLLEAQQAAAAPLPAPQAQPPAPAEPAAPVQNPGAPAPIPQTTPAPQAQAHTADLEHRRAYNREALDDLYEATKPLREAHGDVLSTILTEALKAIVLGKVRHISITY